MDGADTKTGSSFAVGSVSLVYRCLLGATLAPGKYSGCNFDPVFKENVLVIPVSATAPGNKCQGQLKLG